MSLILLVEDFAPMRISTAEVLRQLGHSVIETPSAEAALPMLRLEPVDVLFVDVALPGESGDVFAAEARSLLPDVKLVFGTGLKHFPSSPAGDGPVVLRKPYSLQSLKASLEYALDSASEGPLR